MAKATQSKEFWILLLRGSLGGALGGFVLVATLILVQFGTFGSGAWLIVGSLLFGLPFGAFIGGIVGALVFLINRQTGARMGPIGRVMVGTTIAIVFWEIFFWQKERSEYTYSSYWLRHALGVLLFATATGGIAGVIVGRAKIRSRPLANDQRFEKEEES